MFRYTYEVFQELYSDKPPNIFFDFFKEKGFYLDDLSHIPINHKPSAERVKIRNACSGLLAKRIKSIKPQAIIIVMKMIEYNVRKAIEQSGVVPNNIFVLSFPAGNKSNINHFISGLKNALLDLQAIGVIS